MRILRLLTKHPVRYPRQTDNVHLDDVNGIERVDGGFNVFHGPVLSIYSFIPDSNIREAIYEHEEVVCDKPGDNTKTTVGVLAGPEQDKKPAKKTRRKKK